MNHRTILTAIAQDLTSKGYEAYYLGQDFTLSNLYRLIVSQSHAPDNRIYLSCWNHHPHLITISEPDIIIDLTHPNSIEELYKEINKRLT